MQKAPYTINIIDSKKSRTVRYTTTRLFYNSRRFPEQPKVKSRDREMLLDGGGDYGGDERNTGHGRKDVPLSRSFKGYSCNNSVCVVNKFRFFRFNSDDRVGMGITTIRI